jgi:hypothetical protein
LSGIKEYDLFFKDKIFINQTNYFGDSKVEKFTKDVKLIEKYIIGIKEYKQVTWKDKLNDVERYIIKYGKKPSCDDKDIHTRKLGQWLNSQETNYNKNQYNMKNENIKKMYVDLVEKYKTIWNFKEKWISQLNDVENYILENNRLPSVIDDNIQVKQLGKWLMNQNLAYKKQNRRLKDISFRKIYEEFIKKYSKYFQSTEEIVANRLKLIGDYIDEKEQLPLVSDSNKEIQQLSLWFNTLRQNYKNKTNNMKEQQNIKNYEEFIEKYKKYFNSNIKNWLLKLKECENYMKENNKKPSSESKNRNVKKLGRWLSHQRESYTKNIDIMKNLEIKKIYENFIQEYKIYLMKYSKKKY